MPAHPDSFNRAWRPNVTELRGDVCCSVGKRWRQAAFPNAQGWKCPGNWLKFFECQWAYRKSHNLTLEKMGIRGLWEASGREQSVNETDLQYFRAMLEKEGRTHNSLPNQLRSYPKRTGKLSPDRLRHLLQKKGFFNGNARGIAIKQNKILSINNSNNLVARLLQVAHQGSIELMYLDESGCCLWSPGCCWEI